MQTSEQHQTSASSIRRFYHQPVQDIDSYGLPHFQILDNNVFSDGGSQGTTLSFQPDEYFTLESSTATTGFAVCESPAASISSNRSPISQGSNSCMSYPHHSPDNTYGSPLSGSASSSDDRNIFWQKLREIENSLMEPVSDSTDSCNFCFAGGVNEANPLAGWGLHELMEMNPQLDLKQLLIACAKAVSDRDILRATWLMHVLEQMVSVSGEPIQRLGAYLLEGLKARLELSGSKIYKSLKCEAPMSSDLMTYMGLLYKICPYWRFAYISANVAIQEAVQYEPKIHIIDFQIAQGSQWIPLIEALANRQGGPPVIRITGIDDSQSAYARGGGLQIVGQRLSKTANTCNVPFEFHDAAMSGCEVQREHLRVQPGEAVVVNFPYVLHHMPDESVNTWNHRDRLIRLVKSLSPKIVTLMEQESNTNTSTFFQRFLETVDYYTAMFESIDAARPRDDKQRINAEQHCVARDIVNMVACEEAERVERHELLGKWKLRFQMAEFTQCPLSPSATIAIRNLLREYDRNYGLQEKDGALYLWWKNRPMATSSTWR